jgi:hypothetical protein
MNAADPRESPRRDLYLDRTGLITALIDTVFYVLGISRDLHLYLPGIEFFSSEGHVSTAEPGQLGEPAFSLYLLWNSVGFFGADPAKFQPENLRDPSPSACMHVLPERRAVLS